MRYWLFNRNRYERDGKTKKNYKTGLGFYGYLTVISAFLIFLFGILNVANEFLIFNFPFLEKHIYNFYETINNFKIIILDIFSKY